MENYFGCNYFPHLSSRFIICRESFYKVTLMKYFIIFQSNNRNKPDDPTTFNGQTVMIFLSFWTGF